jgi:hypothetical protein
MKLGTKDGRKRMNVLQNLFLFSPVDSLLNGKEVVKVRI